MGTEETVGFLRVIWDKLSQGRFLSLTLTEILLLTGIVTLTVFACRIIRKSFKVILWILVILLVILFLASRGFRLL